MTNKIFSSLKVIALAVVLSFGFSYVYAWTAPSATPPTGNVSAPINTSATAQTKTGALTVGELTTTSALNMGTNNIVGGGASSAYGATTIKGEKSGWSGINFKLTNGTNSGTLMMHPNYSGFFAATDDRWRMYVDEPVGGASYGTVHAQDYYVGKTGRWVGDGINCTTKSLSTTVAQTLSCDAGYTMTGGGCVWRSDGNDQYVYSYPNGNGWYCQDNDGPISSIYVRCCR